MKNLLLGLLIAYSITLASCLKDPGTPTISASKTTVSVNEQFTLTVDGAENYTCLYWNMMEGTIPTATADFPNGNDLEDVIVSIDTTGVYNFQVSVKNCRGESDPCIGTCRDEYAEISITVE